MPICMEQVKLVLPGQGNAATSDDPFDFIVVLGVRQLHFALFCQRI